MRATAVPLVDVAASLHGRAGEQERLLALLGNARVGHSGAVVVVGEPGAGKSALHDMVRTAAEGMLVLEAKGVQSEATLPFSALHQLLRPAFGLLERLPSPQADALRAAFALEGGGAPDLYRVPLAVLTLLAEAAEDRPLLCVIDDAQWVDGDSAQALTFAARRLHAERIAIVFAAREGGFDAAALPELSLKPLDTTAVEGILAARAGAAVAPDIARRIASATGGNALAVVELAPLLTREQLAGGEPLPQPLPMSSGVERLFADRVRDLPADARLLLLIAAAEDTGRPDAVAAAARRLGSDLTALESAEEAGLVRVEAAEIRFRHPLVRSAIYGTARFAQRRAVHRALAETLMDAGEIDRYAWHLAAATLEPDEEVARQLEQAAGRARSRNAFTAASAAAERAADLSPSPHEKGRRLAEAASDAWLTGLLPQAARLIEAAEPLVDDPVLDRRRPVSVAAREGTPTGRGSVRCVVDRAPAAGGPADRGSRAARRRPRSARQLPPAPRLDRTRCRDLDHGDQHARHRRQPSWSRRSAPVARAPRAGGRGSLALARRRRKQDDRRAGVIARRRRRRARPFLHRSARRVRASPRGRSPLGHCGDPRRACDRGGRVRRRRPDAGGRTRRLLRRRRRGRTAISHADCQPRPLDRVDRVSGDRRYATCARRNAHRALAGGERDGGGNTAVG